MISDSIPWKDELLKIADSLEQRTTQQRWLERTSFLVERDVMVAAYAIRRLLEARKISDELAMIPVTVMRHSLIGKPADVMTRNEFDEHYDMHQPEPVQLTITEFCNQVIHSWVWMLSATEHRPHRFDGIFVSSDWAKKRHIYIFDVETLVRVFRGVGSDDVVSIRYRQDEQGWHFDKVSNAELPDPW